MRVRNGGNGRGSEHRTLASVCRGVCDDGGDMRVNFTFRNLEPSEGIKTYATEKVQKLQKYLRAPLDAEITLSMERHLHRADVNLGADGHRYAAHEDSENMYASIDMVVDKLDRQIRDAKAAVVDRHRHGGGLAQLNGKNK